MGFEPHECHVHPQEDVAWAMLMMLIFSIKAIFIWYQSTKYKHLTLGHLNVVTPRGDEVSMLTYTNPWGRLSSHLQSPGQLPTLHVAWMSDLVICKCGKSMAIHDTECTYWDQVSLNNINQTSKKIAQMDINKMMDGSHTINEWHTVTRYYGLSLKSFFYSNKFQGFFYMFNNF